MQLQQITGRYSSYSRILAGAYGRRHTFYQRLLGMFLTANLNMLTDASTREKVITIFGVRPACVSCFDLRMPA